MPLSKVLNTWSKYYQIAFRNAAVRASKLRRRADRRYARTSQESGGEAAVKRRSVVAIGFSLSMLTVLSTIALATQYVLKAPNRLALPDFKGYETWRDVAASETRISTRAILGNATLIRAYTDGIAAGRTLLSEGSLMLPNWEVVPRKSSPTLTAAAQASTQASTAAGSNEIFHVAIFRFAKEHVNDAITAFRALASASRQESGNLSYNIYRGTEDDQTFYVVEHWASPAALAEHEHTEAFIHFGRGVLVKYATLHDTVTGRAFDVG